MKNPKLFISYSWSTPAHEQWVVDLATELADSGVHVLLDKWDLKEGHDSLHFMERMVNDPEVLKVAMICDAVYVEKANDRASGVGTETQIISREIYENTQQDKFVAIIAEKDEQGKVSLPAYYSSRIYIDLSDPENYAENFEKLLRWIYDRPLHKRPQIGKRPSFLDESDSISLGTTASYKRAVSSIKESKPFALGATNDYLTTFAQNLERFRITENDTHFDELVVKSIENFTPYRNEAISFFTVLSQYSPTEESILKLHRFFEALLPYLHRPENVTSWRDTDFDNFKFIVHELFLYLIAVLLKHERFLETDLLLSQQYYCPNNETRNEDMMFNYDEIQSYVQSLKHRNERLGQHRISVHADLLKERNKTSGIGWKQIMQADFVLFMRNEIQQPNQSSRWVPYTLVYLGEYYKAFEVFARASSKSYFEKMKSILKINNTSDLSDILEKYRTGDRRPPKWDFHTIDPSKLLGYKQLATKS